MIREKSLRSRNCVHSCVEIEVVESGDEDEIRRIFSRQFKRMVDNWKPRLRRYFSDRLNLVPSKDVLRFLDE